MKRFLRKNPVITAFLIVLGIYIVDQIRGQGDMVWLVAFVASFAFANTLSLDNKD